MIYKLYSNLPTFKTVRFHRGLNLIVAHKSKGASEGQTRNGAGKSSVVELINSLLGGNVDKKSLLKANDLKNYRFGLELDVNASKVAVERTGQTSTRLSFMSELKKGFGIIDEDGEPYIPIEEWKATLGKSMYGLNKSILTIKNGPTFRILFSYFARSQAGFTNPQKYFPQQSTCSVQVALTYLLKLNWNLARDFENIRQKNKLVDALRTASKQEGMGDIIGSSSELRTQIHLLQNKVDGTRSTILDFKVLPEYQQKEQRASTITRELSQLSAKDTSAKEWLLQLEKAISEEMVPDSVKVENLFEEASIQLPEIVHRRFEEVQAFHLSVIHNRKEHLKQEIEEIRRTVKNRLTLKKALDDERSEILNVLQSHGALNQFVKLQDALSKEDGTLQLLKQKLETIESLEETKSEIKIEKQELLQQTRNDHIENDKQIKEAIITFANISSKLYDEPGRFIVDATPNGPKFEIKMPAIKSGGITKMQIFCFDMMLMQLWAGETNRPDILVHDSHLFDGVDERQKARALILAEELAEEYNFQYIVTMNSDDLPSFEDYKEFDINNYLVDLDINDSPSGGLFGIRF